MPDEFDLVVLGGGMAGLPVAMKCAYSGLDVALVEKGKLGGTCLNRGCIPTKTMLRSAEIAHLARRSEEFGVGIDGDVTPDLDAIVDRKDDVVASIRKGAAENVDEAENLTLIEEHGVFESAHELRVGDRSISGETVVVNTGTHPERPDIEGVESVSTQDSTSMLHLDEVPESLVVVGGGYIGCEYAQMYSRFGADVAIFQRGARLLPKEEPAVSEVIEDAFGDEAIDVHTGTPVTSVETLGNVASDIAVEADGLDEALTASEVLVATGRRPNTEGIGLAEAGIETDAEGFVVTDEGFETTAAGVYAIGDVSGPPMFTHSARDDADLLYQHLAKDESISVADRTVPWGVFTDPQVGHVGLTEDQARAEGYEVGVGRQDLAEQGKPKALGETEGFVKLVTDSETDELLGAHVVGEQGAEIVHELVLAIELGATAAEIADTIHVHPTLPESINSAAGGVHKPS